MSYENTLYDLSVEYPELMVLTAENRAAIRTLPERLGHRFVDVGIAEQTMVGMAAGFALRGRIPVVHALATFLTLRAFEFVRTDVGIPGLNVKLVGAVPGFLSEANGPTHQAIEDIALMRGIPGMEIYCPSDEQELQEMLRVMVARPGPAYLRFNATKARVLHSSTFSAGSAELLSEGRDVTLLTYGFMLGEAYVARNMLEAQGLSVRLLNLRTLKPIDESAILRAARETRLLVTIEDHFLVGGLHSIVAERLVANRVGARVLPIALDARWFHPSLLGQVLEREGFTGEQIARRVLREVQS